MKIFCIAGTRPEFIKIFPVYQAFKAKAQQDPKLEIKWVSTSQHHDLTKDLEGFFDIEVDFKFDIKPSHDANTRLGFLSSELMSEATILFDKEKPDLIFIQGDTLSAQSCALAAFYQKIKIAHIEAGLRTHDTSNPFPEELSRVIISRIADYNFAPEKTALENLETENKVFKNSAQNFLVGNTVVDTLKYSLSKIKDSISLESFGLGTKPFVLITSHRRENFSDDKITNLFKAVQRLGDKDIDFVFTVHKNPEVKKHFDEFALKANSNIKFLDAPDYASFLTLMKESLFIVTDSGGVQEEAPYLQKPVLVFRNETERLAGIELGLSKLLGTNEDNVYNEILELIENPESLTAMIKDGAEPFGKGDTAEQITNVIRDITSQ